MTRNTLSRKFSIFLRVSFSCPDSSQPYGTRELESQ